VRSGCAAIARAQYAADGGRGTNAGGGGVKLRFFLAALILVALMLFWSAFGFPLALGILIMLVRPMGPSMLPFIAATIAFLGFVGSFALPRKWSRNVH
jgi:hypothetical protein